MLFNSLPFIFLFLPASLAGFHIAGFFGRRAVLAWLSLASICFYAVWNRTFVLLLLGSVLINYGVSRLIDNSQPNTKLRKWFLYSGIFLNLAILFYYKYFYHLMYFISSFTFWNRLHALKFHAALLPLGISFFTFTQIAFLVDLAQGQARAEGFLSYLLFVTFFPHLIAGPLLHHREIMPQLNEPSAGLAHSQRHFRLRGRGLSEGFSLFVFGLAKKVLIADKLAPAADVAFSGSTPSGLWNSWAGLLIYCMQLYFDFSGYSDMAMGIAKMFGISFPWNFNSPWKATNITEYWQRWHITLTRYVTLYLYNPILLAVQRRRIHAGKKMTRKALQTPDGFAQMVFFPTTATMLLTGIWHGAGFQFVIFGALHGFYLSGHQAWKHFRSVAGKPDREPKLCTKSLMRVGVFVQVALALVFFRADSLTSAWRYFANLFGRCGFGNLSRPGSAAAAAGLLIAAWHLPNTKDILGEQMGTPVAIGTHPSIRWRPSAFWAIGLGLLFFASLVSLDGASSFLYFQF